MFCLLQTWSSCAQLPNEKKELGKQDGSLTPTVGVTKRQEKDGVTPAKPVQSGVQLLVDIVVAGILVDTGMQVDEDSLPGDSKD